MTDKELGNKIREWLENDDKNVGSLHDYLGWTYKQYVYWSETGEQPSDD